MSKQMSKQQPRPTRDEESASFWDALDRRQVVVQVCASCQRSRFPNLPTCPYCRGDDAEVVEVSGAGSVYSWVRVHRALDDGPDPDPPYVVATVDLDAGCRMFGRVEPPGEVAIGQRVRPTFVAHDGWTELRFEPDLAEVR